MRHLNKKYPHQLPSKNRSSKHLNMLIGAASVFPAYQLWSDAQLKRFSGYCKNKKSNCFEEELAVRAKRNAEMERRKNIKSTANQTPDVSSNRK